MNVFQSFPFAAVCLAVLLCAGNGALAETSIGLSDGELKATGERMRQTAQQMQKDISDRLQHLRSERAALEAKQAAERRQEAIRAQQQAEKDKAALVATREAKQRETLAAQQESARKAAAARVAEDERKRQAELQEKQNQEAALVRAQRESLDAYKAGSKKRKLGSEPQFGVDL